MDIHRSTNSKEKAGKRINELLDVAHTSRAPVLLLVSGGSALNVLEYIDAGYFDNTITITLADERFVLDGEGSNTTALKKNSWFLKVWEQGAGFINPQPLEAQLMEETVSWYNDAIKMWIEDFPQGKIIALLGMGEDGHVAGVLPMPDNKEEFESLFLKTDEPVVGYEHTTTKNLYKKRMTVTLKFLQDIVADIVVYEVGESKCKRLQHLKKEYAPHIEPADILLQRESVDVFTDCNAVSIVV
jgi:6-phosphogluconolactonase/glucosamine-6-phosphate isomerase/deaminase